MADGCHPPLNHRKRAEGTLPNKMIIRTKLLITDPKSEELLEQIAPSRKTTLFVTEAIRKFASSTEGAKLAEKLAAMAEKNTSAEKTAEVKEKNEKKIPAQAAVITEEKEELIDGDAIFFR